MTNPITAAVVEHKRQAREQELSSAVETLRGTVDGVSASPMVQAGLLLAAASHIMGDANQRAPHDALQSLRGVLFAETNLVDL